MSWKFVSKYTIENHPKKFDEFGLWFEMFEVLITKNELRTCKFKVYELNAVY